MVKADNVEELDALQDAIRQADWAKAGQQARELLAQWRTVKNSVLLFAPVDADASMDAFEAVFVRLVEDLEHEPVDAHSVRRAVEKVLAFLRSGVMNESGRGATSAIESDAPRR